MIDFKDKLIELIDTHSLNHLKDKILSLTEETIFLKKTVKEDYLKIGSSRLCGYPDLPKEIEWPVITESGYGYHDDDIGLLKLFLCQVNLEELPDIGKLPKKGILYFFLGSNCLWGYGERDSEIYYYPDKLNEVQNLIGKIDKTFFTEGDPEDKYHLENGYKIEFEKALTIPDENSEIFESLNLSKKDEDKYDELYCDYRNFLYEKFNKLNMMFGYVDCGGNNLRKNISSYKKLGGEKDWEVIFSIWSDNDTGLNFNDAGNFSFLILNEDLKLMNFDKIETDLWSS